MKLKTWTFDRDDLEVLCTTAMQTTLAALVKDGVLNAEVAQKWKDTHGAIVLTQYSLIGALKKTLFSESPAEGTALHIKVLKLA